MQPMIVTAKLSGVGVVGDGYFPLDSILARVVWERIGRPEVDAAPTVECLEMRGTGAEWYYACSFASADWKGEGKSFWVKRPRYSEIIGRSDVKSITVKSGRFKGYNMPIFYLLAEEIRWCCVGDIQKVRDLLADVSSIGKKRSQGWGVVSKWTVEPSVDDWSESRSGVATRALPLASAVELGLDGDPGWYGVRPAYWDVNNQAEVLLPPLVKR